MSLYKPAKSRFWHYDFQFKGRRFHGSTGVETLRKAEAVERRYREKAALGTFDDGDGLTLDQAAGRWWEEVGRHRKSGRQLEHRLEILIRLVGKNTALADITTRTLAKAIERRRGETYQRGVDTADAKAKRYPLSNATVNADVAKPMRRIMNRARTTWEIKGLAEIDWEALLLPEAETEIRIYTQDQQQAWLAACDETTRMVLTLLLTYGLRFAEVFFAPAAFIPDGPSLVLNNRKKGSHLLPLRPSDARQIAARVGRARAASLSTIWFEEDARGKLVPLTYSAIQSRLRMAARRAGLTAPRLIHGTRHHVGTSILAETGNLKLTQRVLGHKDIKSTLVYAHALDDGLRAALESRNSPEPAMLEDDFTVPKQRRTRKRT